MDLTSSTEIINEAIKDLNGIQFNDIKPFTNAQKLFFENRYTKVISLLPEINKSDLGLEVGLSGGILAASLKRIFSLNELYAIEHPQMVKEFSLEYKKKIRDEGILLKAYDLTNSNFPWKNKFDFVIFSEVLEHLIPSAVPGILTNIGKSLKKNGWLLLTTPNISSLLKRINLLRGVNPVELDLRFHRNATYGHIREYTRSEVEKVVRDSELKVEKSGYFMIDSQRSIFTKIENLSSLIYPSFSNNIFVLARRVK